MCDIYGLRAHKCDQSLLVAGDKQLYEYIVKDGPQIHRCTVCGKISKDRGNLRKHVENIHFPGSFTYSCKYCQETFTSRTHLNHHVTNVHKNAKISFWLQINHQHYSRDFNLGFSFPSIWPKVSRLQAWTTSSCMSILWRSLREARTATNAQYVEKLEMIEAT